MPARNSRSIAAEAAFRARLEELGATLLEPEWLGGRVRHSVICAVGHRCAPIPHETIRSKGICKTCAGRDPADAERRFRERVAELGGEVLAVRWLGAQKKHHVRCSAGHDAYPRPASVQQGNGICWECSGRHPAAAEKRFLARLEELGAVPLYKTWRGADEPHRVRCQAGHECRPRPGSVSYGQGICVTCAGLDPVSAEQSYRALIIDLGGTPLWAEWRGNKAPTRIRCPQGHECHPRPNDVQQGSGMCRTCGGQDPAASEAKFLARLAELGAVPLYETWLGRQNPHRVRCVNGHTCYPRPNSVIPGHGVCRTCAGLDPAVAEAAFRAALAKVGAIPAYEGWRGVDAPHRVTCAGDHDCYPKPGNVQRGGPVCGTCADKSYTVFYVLEHESEPVVKFGISSREGQRRLADHRKDGFTVVHVLLTDLAEGVAEKAERAVIGALALARVKPHRGREYFDRSCLALILDVADSWLAPERPIVPRRWVQDELLAA